VTNFRAKMIQQFTGLLCGRYVILPIYSFQAGVRLQLLINSIIMRGFFGPKADSADGAKNRMVLFKGGFIV
jgi:hypothetical protein